MVKEEHWHEAVRAAVETLSARHVEPFDAQVCWIPADRSGFNDLKPWVHTGVGYGSWQIKEESPEGRYWVHSSVPRKERLVKKALKSINYENMLDHEAHDHAIKVLLCEKALSVQCERLCASPAWADQARDRLRQAVVSLPSDDDESTFAEAVEVAMHETRPNLAVTVVACKRSGIDLTLSLQMLDGSDLEISMTKGDTVAQLATKIASLRGKRSLEVKFIGPKGCILAPTARLPDAVDDELADVGGDAGDATLDNDEESSSTKFYPIAVIAGEAWKELGLDGPSRWRHLSEADFEALVGMKKNAFEKLPGWKQLTLKKKNHLF